MKYCTFCGEPVVDKSPVCHKCKRPISQVDAEVFPEIRPKKKGNAPQAPDRGALEEERQRAAQAAGAPEDPAEELHRAMTEEQRILEKNRALAAAAYLGVLFFVPLVRFKGEEANYGRFHANQGLIILILMIAISLLSGFARGASWSAALCAGLTGGTLYLAIVGIERALRGKMQPLPIFGGITIIPQKKD